MVMLYGIIGGNKRENGVEPQQPRRMNDMGPRRSMDMGPRRPRPVQPPAADAGPAVRPVQAQRPLAQPQPPVARPAAPAQPQRPMRPQASERQQYAEAVPETTAPKARVEAKSGGWRTVLQVIIGLVVIAAVASAIVVLYIKYYQ